MDFWMGIIFGLFLGTNIGVILAGLLLSWKHRDDADIFEMGGCLPGAKFIYHFTRDNHFLISHQTRLQ